MTEQLIISIPTRIHYKKFIEKEYVNTVVLTNPFGAIVYHLLKKEKADKYSEDIIRKFPSSMEMKLAAYKLERKYLNPYLSAQGVHDLNMIIESMFKRELFRYVAAKHAQGIERQDAIQDFMNQYELLDSDVSHEALRRAEWRYRVGKRSA